MPELKEQLQRTLGDNYSLERELGGGGMSRVRRRGAVARAKELGVEAAKCAHVIERLRSDLASIEGSFRALEHASGDDAIIE